MNESAVVPFYFQENEVRTITINNEPWFVAKDVCDILGLGNVTNALLKVPAQHLTLIELRSGGQIREMNAVSEPGLYRLILRSDKQQAEPFMEWVTAEVLPSIRKTGGYLMAGNSALDAMAVQIIQMVVPAVISQVMAQVAPMIKGLSDQVKHVQINFSHVGTVWSFSYHCCQEGNTNTYVEKDELYKAYCEYCATIPYCHAEGKTAFLTKVYRAFTNTYSATINRFGRKVQVVRGIALISGYSLILADLRIERQHKDEAELQRRRQQYVGLTERMASLRETPEGEA